MPTTPIDEPEMLPKSGKRTRKPASQRKPARIGAESKRRPAARTTKTEQVFGLLRRSKGASLSDLSSATGWQSHSIRGFLSGTIKKKMGLAVVGETDGKGIRRYRVAVDVAA